MARKPPEKTDLARLESARDRLEQVVNDPATSPRDLATVSREYRLLVEKIATMAPTAQRSALDEIAARRQKRGTA